MGAVVLLALVAIPLLAGVVFVGRAIVFGGLLALLVAGLVAYGVSPRFREWLQIQDQPEVAYGGLRLATDVALAPGHVWARIGGREATVGVDDLVQSVLGPVEEIDLPAIGGEVHKGDALFHLRRGDRRVAAWSPVDGRVTATNESLGATPGAVNESPFSAGWVVRLEGDGMRRQRRELFRGGEARTWFRGEVDRLIGNLLATEAVPTLPDGGILVGELYRHIDDDAWQMLSRSFFRRPASGRDAS